MGAKKFDMSVETRETKLSARDIPGFCRDILRVPEKFEKKNCVQVSSPRKTASSGPFAVANRYVGSDLLFPQRFAGKSHPRTNTSFRENF